MRSTKKWLILAPHLKYPTVNGADIVIDGFCRELCHHIAEIHLITEDTYFVFKDGVEVVKQTFSNISKGKYAASFFSVLKSTSYQVEKFITASYRNFATAITRSNSFDVVFYSLISTGTLLNDLHLNKGVFNLIYTQNNDFKLNDDTFLSSNNFLKKQIAIASNKWTRKFLEKQRSNIVLVNITKEDDDGYKKEIRDINSLVLPAGVDINNSRIGSLARSTSTTLSFLGSLSAQMNIDAVQNFSSKFWPTLKNQINGEIIIQIIGSNPSVSIQSLCNEHGWHLHQNVSDSMLEQLIQASTFTIMPFEYSNGSKLKLLKSLSLGVPVLSTVCSAYISLPKYCLTSDNPEEWAQHINSCKEDATKESAREIIANFAKHFSWKSVIANFRKDYPKFF